MRALRCDVNAADRAKSAWKEEYQRKGIPSSFRKDPTKTVVQFISWLKDNGHGVAGTAADIGCGQGRNSFYLASQGFKVTALELLEENANLVNAEALSNHLPIRAFAQDASDSWPMEKNSLSIVIDVFCYKHITDKKMQARYRQQLWEAIKSDGFYFISLASERDGFYGPLLNRSPRADEKLIVDPHSTIASFLYSIDDLKDEFADFFETVKIEESFSTSPMYGNEYDRVVINAIFKKRSL